jgi:hypothetical protein
VLNHQVDTKPAATRIAGTTAELLSLEGLDHFAGNIRERLSSIVADPSATPEDTTTLLRYLAVNGSALYEALMDGLGPEIRAAERIQVLSVHPESFLPVEFFYDRPIPERQAPLCPNADAALESGVCGTSCPSVDTAPYPVVCPLGFWSLSRVIERRAGGADEKKELRGRADVELRIEPTTGRRSLDPDRCALFAYSDRVDRRVAVSATVADALAEVTHDRSTLVRTWDEWKATVARNRPSLLVLLPHTVEDSEFDQPALEIADGDQLLYAYLTNAHVIADAESAPPIVLVLGCDTAAPDIPFESFVLRFHDKGAAIVVGTLATVLGAQAAPVAAAMVRALRDVAATGEASFGDVMRRVRRSLLRDGLAMAMTLTSYGDADWRLSADGS